MGNFAVDAKGSFSTALELVEWFGDRPREYGEGIAVRAALRVLPLTFTALDGKLRISLILESWRAAFVTWAVARYGQTLPSNAAAAREAARHAADAAARTAAAAPRNDAAAYAAAFAARGATVGDVVSAANHYAHAVDAGADAARGAAGRSTDYWLALNADATWLSKQNKASAAARLMAEPLWLIDVRGDPEYLANFPPWARTPFDAFANSDWAARGPWGVWTAWYRELLPGHRSPPIATLFGERIALEIASQSPSFWLHDPHRVTAEVAALAGWKWDESGWDWPDEHADSSFGKSKRPRPKPSHKAATSETETPTPAPLPPPIETVGIHSDEATDVDQLGRWPFAKALAEHLDDVYWQQQTKLLARDGGARNNPADADGFAMHIHAPWGAGKTSVVKMMKTMLERTDRPSKGGRIAPQWVVVEFNAWKNERRNPPWWPLLEEIKTACISALRRSDVDNARRLGRYWLWWKARTDLLPYVVAALVLGLSAVALGYIWKSAAWKSADIWTILGNVFKLITAIGTAIAAIFVAFISASRFAVFGSANSAKIYEDLSQDPLKKIVRLFNKTVETTNKPICIVIDDLDRCRPDYIVALLQGVQTIFRHRNVAYVVPADRNWIKTSFETQYKDPKDTVGSPSQPLGYLFLEKLFQVSTPLPALGAKIRAAYWDALLKSPAGEPAKADVSQLSSPQPSEPAVEREREEIRKQTDNLTHAKAQDILNKKDTPEVRAALALELSTSKGATTEATHLLVQFKDCVPEIPRVMKRMLNAYAIRQAMGFVAGSQVPIKALVRWTILEQSDPALADALAAHPDWVEDRENIPKDSAFADQIGSKRFAAIVGSGEDRLTAAHIRTLTRGDEAAAPAEPKSPESATA
jgi:hypothetical protein